MVPDSAALPAAAGAKGAFLEGGRESSSLWSLCWGTGLASHPGEQRARGERRVS